MPTYLPFMFMRPPNAKWGPRVENKEEERRDRPNIHWQGEEAKAEHHRSVLESYEREQSCGEEDIETHD